MTSNDIYCPRCNSGHVYRHSKSAAGCVHYRCPACPHVFQLTKLPGKKPILATSV